MACREAAAAEEEELEERFQALRQTPNRGRSQTWILAHRAVRMELERVWEVLQDHKRQLDAELCQKMDDWDHRHLSISDNIVIAGHVIEAIKRHREVVDQASSQTPTADEPSARFNAWWLRAYRCFLGVGGFLDCALLGLRISWITGTSR